MNVDFEVLNHILYNKTINIMLINEKDIYYFYSLNELHSYKKVIIYDIKSSYRSAIPQIFELEQSEISYVWLPKSIELIIHYVEELD
ncbi:hypothetical protein D3C87_80670 [compost metagenome]